MKSLAIKFILFILLWCIGTTGCTQSQTITIENAWARPALSGDNGAVYFELHNPAPSQDTILGASSQIAEKAEIHESTMDSAGTMSMHPQHSVAIPPNDTVIFKPGGLHVMLVALNHDLKIGDFFQLTLTLENSGNQTINVEVKQP